MDGQREVLGRELAEGVGKAPVSRHSARPAGADGRVATRERKKPATASPRVFPGVGTNHISEVARG